MADSSVFLEVIVEGKNIKLVQRDVEELAGSINRASNAQDKNTASSERNTNAQKKQTRSGQDLYNNQRALINGSLSSGRANAKLASGITSGLVPAYAALAANIFAVTAFFGALQRAASLEQLEAGLIATGEAAGRNLPKVAEGLQQITNFAISTKDALETTAIAFSAGFSTTQLERLTKVADGASKALGRDLTDSLTRLVRGTAKLEPEILDELGIMVRLDDATNEYAAAIGKTANELTRFERQQAFLTATLEQGEKKFGDITKAVDANPYNQLAASFQDLSKVIFKVLNTVVTPFVEFLSTNKLALTAALLLLGSTVTNQVVSPLQEAAAASAALAANAAAGAAQAAKKVGNAYSSQLKTVQNSLKTIPAGFDKFVPSIERGTISVSKLREAVKTLERSEKARARNLEAGRVKDRAQKEQELAEIRALKAETLALIDVERQRGATSFTGVDLKGLSTSQKALSTYMDRMDRTPTTIGKFKVAMRGAGVQLKIMRIQTGMAIKSQGLLKGSLLGVRAGFRAAGASARLFGAALVNAIPIVGQIIFVAGLLFEALSWIWKDTKLEAGTKELVDSFKAIEGTATKLNSALEDTDLTAAEKTNAVLQTRIGLVDQLAGGLTKLQETSEQQTAENLEKPIKNLARARATLEKARKRYQEAGYNEEQIQRFTQHYVQQVTNAENIVQRVRDKGTEADKDAVNDAINGWMARVMASESTAAALEDEVKQVTALQDRINRGDFKGNMADAGKELSKITEGSARALAASDELDNGFNELNKSRIKFTKGQESAFDPMIENLNSIANSVDTLFETAEGKTLISTEKQEKALELFGDIKKIFPDLEGSAENLDTALRQGVLRLREQVIVMQTAELTAKKLSQEAKTYGEFAKDNAGFARLQLEIENEATKQRIAAKEAELKLTKIAQADALRDLEKQNAATGDQALTAEQIASNNIRINQIKAGQTALETQIATLASTINDEAEITYKTTLATVEADKEKLALEQKIASMKQKSAEFTQQEIRSNLELQRALTGGGLTAEDEYNLVVAANNSKRLAEEERLRMQQKGIELEYKLLRAKVAFENSRMQNIVDDVTASERARKAAQEGIDANTEILSLINDAESSAVALANEESRINQILWSNTDALALEKSRRADIALSLQESEATLERITALSLEGADYAYKVLVNLQKRAQLESDLTTALENYKKTAEGLQRVRELQLEVEKSITQETQLQLDNAESILRVNTQFANGVVSALKTTSQLNKEMAELANTNPFTGKPVSLAKAFEINEKERKERLAIAQLEASIRKATIQAEFNLIKAKFGLLKAEFERADSDGGTAISPAEQAVIDANQRIIDQQEILNGLTLANIDKELELVKKKNEYEKRREAVTTAEAAAKAGSQIVGDGQGGGLLAASQIISSIFGKKEEKTDIEKTIEGIFGDKEVTAEDLQGATLDAILKNPEMMAEKLGSIINGNSAAIGNQVSQAIASSLATMMVNTLNAAVLNVGGAPTSPTVETTAKATETSVPESASPQRSPEVQEIIDAGEEYGNLLREANARSQEELSNTAATIIAEGQQQIADTYATAAEATKPAVSITPDISAPSIPAPGSTGGESPSTAGDTGGINTVAEAAMAGRIALQGFAADMAQLGPEGEAVSNFVNGGLALADSISSTIANFQAAEGASGKAQAIMAGVSSAIGAIGQMQAAASQQRVAQLDKEIAAEKQRDGKSKESLAKIAALEKKKEQEKKKAFEKDKKMKMAQTVINTAAAIMTTLGQGGIFAIPMAIMMAAMGAAQLAMISSQTYEGGGSGSSSLGGPTSIAIGERKSTVDLAKSQSASGELAYMRGEKGIGGPENFTPAFMGAKYRAVGGPTTGYVVGEQGPELFVPEVPGNIVPNNQTQQVAPTNVNFTITALDASGVEDILVRQRGNIIGMMREAANSYGQPFLEGVDVASYTQEAGGVTRY